MRKIFTGIIEEIGIVKQIINYEKSSELIIECKKVLEGIKIGDSIATNGVCLTVVRKSKNDFVAEAMAETLRCSNLSEFYVGCKVNLERALSYNGRFNGHIVTGHVDGIGRITSYEKESIGTWITIKPSLEIIKNIVYKGSITLDGVSLTVADVNEDSFKVCIIPHTKEETTLLNKEIGSKINIECDVISKYIEKILYSRDKENSNKNNITINFLKENGFY